MRLPGPVTSCGVCGSWNLSQILDLGDQPLAERHGSTARYPLALLECQECTLLQLSYAVPHTELFPPDHPYTTGNTKALRSHYAALGSELAGGLAPGDLAVDIGCNDGTLLAAFPPAVRRLGVEPTAQAWKCAVRGIAVWQEYFTADVARAIRQTHGPAKVVTACNVLAHVPDPHDFIDGVTWLLGDDGVFVTENHDAAAVVDGLQIDAVYHEHLRYYTTTSLARLLGPYGLVITRTDPVATHGGSLRTWARRQHTTSLASRAYGTASRLRGLLASLDGPVYGIGATTRATPLIHYAKIAPYLACVCEVPGSDKIGTTMPGTAIPVVDEAKLTADQPPYALLLAWHLAGDLIPSLRAKGYRGRFILPLPIPQVTDD